MPSALSTITTAHDSSSSSHDTSRLAPDDAYYRLPLPRSAAAEAAMSARKRREIVRSASRRQKGNFKKLLWIKQPFPDNYTDEETFLDHLQRNPRLQPYEFWALMADATVIVQHVASVAIFCCFFNAINHNKVSSDSIVRVASLLTVLGWGLWDYWMAQEEAEAAGYAAAEIKVGEEASSSFSSNISKESRGLGLSLSAANAKTPGHSRHASQTSVATNLSTPPKSEQSTATATSTTFGYQPPYSKGSSSFSPRNQQRLATAKSAVLIYAALLGLSPILKSLTRSTTADSIWALSTCLLCINVAFFDYGGGTGAHLPASISTNSALMASTVLASRLSSTTDVFALTLFSIEVFGLFPIFRRHLREKSSRGHLVLTIALVVNASGGVFVTLAGGGWRKWLGGVFLGGFLTFLTMGICSWWFIGLQKYKNEIHGPWDPARPIIRRRWD